MKTSMKTHRRSERGMTLMETLIAVFIFTIVFLTALALYQSANRAYLQTDAAAIQQQNVRFGMDRMLESLRDAGAGYNTLGSGRLADEQIEGAWESAIFVRGNFNNQRETALETTSTAGFSIVTTGNDEIVGYVLRKPGANNVNITIKADLTSGSGKRDAIYTSQTNITNEETRTIAVAATTVAQQTDPPYQLTKVTFDSAGNPVYEVVADNIYRMKFEYFGAAGRTLPADAIITAASGSGSADSERDERAAVRRIRTKLMGMADRPDFNYNDPWTYGADFSDLQSTLKSDYHKFALEEMVLSSNLGVIGRKHNTVPAITLTAPASITVCTGHCRYFHVTWPATVAGGVTDYVVRVTAPAVGTYSIYSNDSLVSNTLEYTFRDPDAVASSRTFSFQVASTSSGNVGTFTAAASLISANDNSQSIPGTPTNVTGSSGAGNTESVSWDAVTTNTGTITSTAYCTSAGSVTGGSAPPSPWNVGTDAGRLVDLKNYKVYRVRSTGSNNGGDATIRVDTGAASSIGTLVNTTPTSNAFTDHTAAPCSTYFYRIQSCDECDLPAGNNGLSTAMSTPVGPADPGVNPDAPGGANRADAVTGTTATVGSTYVSTINWPAVIQTQAGRPAATAHYRVTRRKRVGSGGWNYDPPQVDVFETNASGGLAPLTYTDSQPSSGQSGNVAYEYYVQAVYDCPTEHTSLPAGPYSASCNATNTISISTPASPPSPPTEISTPFESGFTPRVTVNGLGTITSATATITGPDPSNNVVWSDTQSGAGPNFTFAIFDNAPTLPVGTYEFNVFAIVDGCKTSTYSQSFILGDATCGLSATNITLDRTSGNNDNVFNFNVQNTCDPSLGGLNFTVTGMRLTWAGFGGSRTIKEVRIGSPTGTLLTATPLNATTGTAFTFLVNQAQVINAGTTTANKWYVIYSADMKNGNNTTTWSSVIANTTTPSNANDEILPGSVTP